MPTTPEFSLTQDATFVFVNIHVPYVRVSDMEMFIAGKEFSFWCKPYLLKLFLPHEVIDDDRAKATYKPDEANGTIVAQLPKAELGLEFEDLDMITKLMQPKKSRPAGPSLIEVLNSTGYNEEPLEAPTDDREPLPTTVVRYGFNSMYEGVLKGLDVNPQPRATSFRFFCPWPCVVY
jgi:protein SHQ1